MNLFSWLFGAAAATTIVTSPLPNSYLTSVTQQPATSFGQIEQTAVLGETVLAPTPTLTPAPTPIPRITRKLNYTLALLGDSMIDTLGPNAPHLVTQLKHAYPGISFSVHNFGVGGTNIDYGLERVTSGYTYLGKQMPSLVSVSPDIVVVESFGYNPYTYTSGALEQHWLQLAAIVDRIKQNIPKAKIIIAATIAPNSTSFGDGAPGIAFSISDKQERTRVIKSYLDSTVKFANSQKLPLADAYHPSLDAQGDGKSVYINAGDHIHYSDAGRSLIGQKITEAIMKNKLLE